MSALDFLLVPSGPNCSFGGEALGAACRCSAVDEAWRMWAGAGEAIPRYVRVISNYLVNSDLRCLMGSIMVSLLP